MINVLIVDDDRDIRDALETALRSPGREIQSVSSANKLLDAVSSFRPHVVLLDLKLKSESGMDYIQKIQSVDPQVSVAVLTGYGSIEKAVKAMRLGADHFFTKPADAAEIGKYLASIEEYLSGRGDTPATENGDLLERLVCKSTAMFDTHKLIKVAARSDVTVLLQGETGTGKGLVSQALHQMSDRREKPFVDVNCAAFSRELVESELFGHEIGAFTGAVRRKEGLWAAADGGTLFLDEIGDLPIELQPKILKAIEEGTFRRVGGTRTETSDTRVIVATNKELDKEAREGRFREDLYHRLNVFKIDVPPLRDRREDIVPLAIFYAETALKKKSKRAGKIHISPEVEQKLLGYTWPGNVRELHHAVEHAVLIGNSNTLQLECFPKYVLDRRDAPASTRPKEKRESTVDAVERKHILSVLESTNGNKKKAAELLGISRETLYKKLRKYKKSNDPR
jgi:DNA-binding NtrC family response regulator